MTLVTRDRI